MFCAVKQSPLLHVRLRKQLLTIAKLGSVSLTPEHKPHRRSLFKEQNRTSRRSSSTPGRFFNVQLREMASSSEAGKKKNRLAYEKSPYLLQHATNPVDWYPWGNEAFEKAKRENKPIFLSVGYSTCHWCHVMERESFESDEVAAILNDNYVSIKVDREERPDVDRIYMAFVQRTTGGGGWPMSVFMTPDLSPLYGGTYFPPEDEFGRVGFKNLLRMISKQWQKQHNILQKEANDSVVQLKQLVTKKYTKGAKIPSRESWMKCFQQISKSYDTKHGGFSSAPKFPQPTMFNFLFHFYSKNKTSTEGSKAKSMCLHTLEKMAYGGIHDHVNCGFARYSVDQKWHLPHFEKMLYDQAQLVVAYVDAYVVSKNVFFAEVIDDILTYVGRDLSHKEGGFYGAEDADSYPCEGNTHEKKEGAFCVWEFDELKALLTGKTLEVSHFDLYTFHFNVNPDGNVKPEYDRHGELLKKNVLSCFGSYEETAREFNITVDQVKETLKICNKLLYDKRQSRPKPHVDTKIVTSWNGMMISGYAKAGFALKKCDYTARAITAANFIRSNLYGGDVLLRCCYGDQEKIVQTETPIQAFLDDFVCLIRGLLDLYEATLDTSWLEWAEKLQAQQDEKFWDSLNYGYFSSSSNDSTLIVRDKDDQDGAEPCGNSVAVHNLIRLSGYLDRKDLREKAGKILSAYSERLNVIPVALPEMTSALMLFHTEPMQVFIAGKTDDTNTQALLDVVRNRYMPGKILAVADGPEGRAGLLYARHAYLKKLKPIQGKSAAYVCRNFACTMPVTDPDSLASSLDSDIKKMRRGSDSDSDSD